jgi:hypothetical protein
MRRLAAVVTPPASLRLRETERPEIAANTNQLPTNYCAAAPVNCEMTRPSTLHLPTPIVT